MTSNFIHFAGLNLRGFSRDAIYSSEEFPKIIVTVNADIFVSANKNKELAKIIEDNFGTIDGQIPFLFASKLSEKNGNNLEKISGSDFVIELLERAALEDKRIFMLGATPESNRIAVEKSREKYNINIQGFSPYLCDFPFTEEWIYSVREKVSAFKPHFIFVALGCPKQEYWMALSKEWMRDIGVEIAIGCGGSIDFLSGKYKRAPVFIQKIGLESIYRFLVEPKLFRVKRILRSFLFFRYIFK